MLARNYITNLIYTQMELKEMKKNVPIKFRGLAIKDYNFKPLEKKRLVYGNVWLNEDNSFAIIGEYKRDGLCYNYVVEPDSIAQLVGYDENGQEVYD